MDASKGSSVAVKAALATLALALAPAESAAVTTVYKCFDRNLDVVYTDQPCRGEQLDIEAGKADPNALAELARERDALARAVAQRIADNRRYPVAAPDYVASPPFVPDTDVYYPAGWGYYAPYGGDVRGRGRGNPSPGGDNRARATRSVPAVPPNGIGNRIFR